MATKLTTEDFIRKAVRVHGTTYDYSKSVYVSSKLKLEIVCLEHGSFFQTPNNHISNKSGCRICGNVNKGGIGLSNGNVFIKKANIQHNNKYDYSLVEYQNARTKVRIICKQHGIFRQTPNGHLANNSGCPTCSRLLIGARLQHAEDDFLAKAKRRHGVLYDYSKVVYITSIKNVAIGCRVHGIFYQRASNHIAGRGCPRCSRSRSNNTTIGDLS